MKIPTRLLTPALAALFLAFVPAADELRFDPKPGTEVAKKLDVSLELSFDEIDVVVDGQPIPAEALGQVQDMTVTLELALAATEKLVGVKDGKATELLRTYDTLLVKADTGEESKEENVDKLEGKTVRFLWDAEKSEYQKTWHECSGEDEILTALSPDMEVSALLPERKVAKGDKWQVSGTQALSLLLPGVQGNEVDLGKTSMGEDEAKAAQIILDELGSQFAEAVKALQVTCEYAGSHETDGVELAEVTLHMQGDLKLDLGSLVERLAEEMDPSGGMKPDVTASLSLGLKGEGTLLWNSATRMLHSYQLDADVQIHADVDAAVDANGESHSLKANLAIGGKGAWKLGSKKP